MSELGYEATVEGLVRTGVPREKAELRARLLYPDVAKRLDAEVQRKENVREHREQNAIRKMAIAVRLKVYSLSQARAAKQTPGLPDLWMTGPTRCLAFWWESKRQVGGKRSQAQLDFAAECQGCGVGYGFGDRYDFADFLRARGITPPAIPTD
jgi:hypothetical protein